MGRAKARLPTTSRGRRGQRRDRHRGRCRLGRRDLHRDAVHHQRPHHHRSLATANNTACFLRTTPTPAGHSISPPARRARSPSRSSATRTRPTRRSSSTSPPGPCDIADGQGIGTILDTDPAAIAIGDVTVTEGNAGRHATFTVSCRARQRRRTSPSTAPPPTGPLRAKRLHRSRRQLTFAPGETRANGNGRGHERHDRRAEETFAVNLSSADERPSPTAPASPPSPMTTSRPQRSTTSR